jgi:tetratricopeptide (TPR) repeat protein
MSEAEESAAKVGGRYRLVRETGRAAGAVTYLAEDLVTRREVAVTELDWAKGNRAALAQLEHEMRALGALSHPSIPRQLELVAPSADIAPPYVVNELVAGESFADLVAAGWSADESQAKQIARQLLLVLLYLHSSQPPILHRHLRPEDIIRRQDGQLYVLGFGGDPQHSSGDRGFMAPEQFRGTALPASDLHAVGALLVFLLARRAPSQIPQKGLRADFRSVIQLSAAFAGWLDKLLEPDPELRFRTAREALDALYDGPARAPRSRRLARVGLIAAGAGLVLALVVGGVTYLLDRVTTSRGRAPAGDASAASDDDEYIEPIATLRGQWGPTFSLAFDAEGKRLFTASRDGTVKVWDLDAQQVMTTLPGHSGKVLGLSAVVDDRMLLSGDTRAVRLWSLVPEIQSEKLADATSQVIDVELSADGRRAAAGGEDGKVRVWDMEAKKLLHTLDHHGRVHSLVFGADGASLASAGASGDIHIWNIDKGVRLRSCKGHAGSVNKLQLATDGQTLVSAGDDRTLRAWHYDSCRQLRSFEGHRDEVWAVAVSPNGKTMVSGDKADVIRTWDLYQGFPIKHQRAHLNGVIDLAFTRDGKRFAAGGPSAVKLWHAHGAVWRPPLPPENWKPPPAPPEPEAKSKEEELTRKAEALLYQQDSGSQVIAQAFALVREALALNPDYAPAHVQLARATFKDGYLVGDDYKAASLTSAHEHADKAIALDPKLASAYLIKGYVYQAERNYGQARKMADDAGRLAPDDVRVHLLRAEIAEDEGRNEEVVASCRIVLERSQDPRWMRGAYQNLATAYARMKDYEAADDMYIAQIRVEPGSAWAKGNYANFLNHRGKHERAIQFAKEALAIMDYGRGRKTLAEAHAGMAIRLTRAKSFDAAKEHVDAAVQTGSSSEELAFAQGYLLRERAIAEGDARLLEQSKPHFERALRMDPKHYWAKRMLDEHDDVKARLSPR